MSLPKACIAFVQAIKATPFTKIPSDIAMATSVMVRVEISDSSVSDKSVVKMRLEEIAASRKRLCFSFGTVLLYALKKP